MTDPHDDDDKPWWQIIGHDLVRLVVLVWAAGILTAYYMGVLDRTESSFIASVFMSTAMTYGIQQKAQNNNGQKKQPPAPPKQ